MMRKSIDERKKNSDDDDGGSLISYNDIPFTLLEMLHLF